MIFPIDVHTHSIASGHAYSTIMENAKYASETGMKILAVTDHGPAMPNAPYYWYFSNLRIMPRELFGVTMLYGCEANITDYDGTLDLPEEFHSQMDILIASLHDPVMKIYESRDKNTQAFLNAMDNPNVHIIGHPGNPKFPIHEEEVVLKAKEKNILIEINNSSFVSTRAGSKEVCSRIASLCKKHGVQVVVNSDAHFCHYIGRFTEAMEILKAVDFPEELIVNSSVEKFVKYLESRGKDITKSPLFSK